MAVYITAPRPAAIASSQLKFWRRRANPERSEGGGIVPRRGIQIIPSARAVAHRRIKGVRARAREGASIASDRPAAEGTA